VEDGISNLSTLSQALTTQHAAVEDARRQLSIANNRYNRRRTDYLNVITGPNYSAHQPAAGDAVASVSRWSASVYLVKALGGGWDASEIKDQQVHPQAIQSCSHKLVRRARLTNTARKPNIEMGLLYLLNSFRPFGR